jgi:7-cyano-7-deazaguanine tRNA-ribosyltransferase
LSKGETLFEVKSKDLLGRIGSLRAPRRTIETPALLPVINPSRLVIPANELYEEFGVRALITNAYLLMKSLHQEAVRGDIHGLLGFEGLIATDSGAYQILKYGGIDSQQSEILAFQEAIHPDIGIILDVPTGSEQDVKRATLTVEETIRRADEAVGLRRDEDIIWCGPIQGGTHLDLVRHAAREMAKRPYPILALGSPTVIMERYQYKALIDMIATAKMNIPPSRPLHLFGAGHPSMLSFAVAMGCDLFDSAAYALFAYEDRYMTDDGTLKLQDMRYLPCNCPICSKTSAEELKGLGPRERAQRLARHNLWVSLQEVRRIKQAILDGRLWELLERRSRAHPALQEALLALGRHGEFIERHAPSDKPRGIFYYGMGSMARPEIRRFRKRLSKCLASRARPRSIMFITYPWGRLSNRSIQKANLALCKSIIDIEKVNATVFVPPFGPVPLELLDAYPVGKTTMPDDLDEGTINDTIEFCADLLLDGRGNRLMVVTDGSAQADDALKGDARLRRAAIRTPTEARGSGGRPPKVRRGRDG